MSLRPSGLKLKAAAPTVYGSRVPAYTIQLVTKQGRTAHVCAVIRDDSSNAETPKEPPVKRGLASAWSSLNAAWPIATNVRTRRCPRSVPMGHDVTQ